MTSNRRIHRLAAFTALSVLFAVTSTVSALASGGSQHESSPSATSVVAPVSEPSASASAVAKVLRPAVSTPVATVPVKPVAKPAPVARPKAVVKSVAVATKPAARPKATTAPKAPSRTAPVAATRVVSTRTIRISAYVDAPGSQAAIDKCHLVLWSHHPLWLAGHNWCGFQWLAYVATGTTVRVTSGAAAGTFVVFGHMRLSSQGGAMPRTGADLVLQTCIGSGTGLTLLHRV